MHGLGSGKRFLVKTAAREMNSESAMVVSLMVVFVLGAAWVQQVALQVAQNP